MCVCVCEGGGGGGGGVVRILWSEATVSDIVIMLPLTLQLSPRRSLIKKVLVYFKMPSQVIFIR